MQTFSVELERKIRELIYQCGTRAEDLAKQPYSVSEKGPEDYVTSVDRELDRLLTAGFSELFPQDGIITEENERSRLAFNGDREQLWCIDPLDGTEGFIQGKPHYSVMIGLLSNFQPIAGWIYAPALEQMYYGGTDWGLFQSVGGSAVEPLSPVEPPPPNSSVCPIMLGDRDQRNFGEAIAQLVPGVCYSSLGSFGLKVMEVIYGRAGLYLYLNGRVKLWDTAGPVALAKAAGLVCCDLEGKPLSFEPSALSSDTLIHKQAILIGWPSYVEALRSPICEAVLATQTQ
ncbi:3'(2'),5'-bisphosphate nucleotidase CysQ [Oscillatoria sp. HE19RPO]|uniref:3'(2'),5'-bisphosphate nucleotidase CysQ family protein n=1 Tax=Oscillatoria sp. HE19RPO TaxID=2954806 RepID=UPI0020C474C4|nr:inositol monophosphatase family protein [Oscillatoria sp. HE19RPO]